MNDQVKGQVKAKSRRAPSPSQDGSVPGKDHRVRVLSLTSGKGGVGKTCVSVNLAYWLSKAGAKVLLLDADLGLANVDIVLGLRPEFTLQHVLCSSVREKRALCNPACALTSLLPGFIHEPLIFADVHSQPAFQRHQLCQVNWEAECVVQPEGILTADFNSADSRNRIVGIVQNPDFITATLHVELMRQFRFYDIMSPLGITYRYADYRFSFDCRIHAWLEGSEVFD